MGEKKLRKIYLRHDWKKINLVTISKRGRLYDAYRCKRCGITGKRFGLDDIVVRDKKYWNKKYFYCQKRK